MIAMAVEIVGIAPGFSCLARRGSRPLRARLAKPLIIKPPMEPPIVTMPTLNTNASERKGFARACLVPFVVGHCLSVPRRNACLLHSSLRACRGPVRTAVRTAVVSHRLKSHQLQQALYTQVTKPLSQRSPALAASTKRREVRIKTRTV